MPDEITNTVQESSKNEPSATFSNGYESVSLNVSHLVGLSALGLMACFFLPWISILFGKVSGFTFTKEGGLYLSLWAIPVFCILTFFAGITKTSQRNAAIFTGLLPFVALGFGMADVGLKIYQILEIGGYGSLIFGLMLIVLPCRLK